MNVFAIAAALLVLVALAFLLPPLWFRRTPAANPPDPKTANLAIYRDQLAELDKEREAGLLDAASFDEARTELQKRLLEDVGTEAPAAPAGDARGTSRFTAILLMVFLPLFAGAAYLVLGSPRALDPANVTAPPAMTQADVEAMVNRLAERMQANPDDMQGWIMLGRSYKMLGRHEEAVRAFSRAEKEIAKDPELLASYAETLAMAGGKGLAGKPTRLIEQALKLDPNHAHSLFLAGAAAAEAGKREEAIRHWEALLRQVEAGSELDQILRKGIEQLRQAK